MKSVGYYNGTIGLVEEMTVPMNDRGLYFGDGVYDAMYAANRTIFEADAHIARFFNSCRALRLPLHITKEALLAELQKCVDLMDSDGEVFVYLQCTRGTGPRKHEFLPEGTPANLLITVRAVPLAGIRDKRTAILVEDTRFFHCNIKTINLIPNVMASQQAKEAGCDEAIFHRGDRVTECAHCNVHILKNGVLHTAQTDNLILPGVTRKHILRVCERLHIPFVEEAFTVDALMDADEVIVTSTSILCSGISAIDGKPVGGKAPALLSALQENMARDFSSETGYPTKVLER